MASSIKIVPEGIKGDPKYTGNVRQLVADLEEVITPKIIKCHSTFTGDYYFEEKKDPLKGKIQAITLYSATKDKNTRKNASKLFQGVAEDAILDVRTRGLDVETTYYETKSPYTTGALDVEIFWTTNKGKRGGTKILRYGIKPGANAKDSLYHVLAQECLQVLACGYRQAKGSKIENAAEFRSFLQHCDDKFAGKTVDDPEKDRLLIDLQRHVHYGSADGKDAEIGAFGLGDDEWIVSSVSTANELVSEYGTGKYYFCHSSSNWVEWFEKAFTEAKKDIIDQKVFGDEIKAGHIDRNKWNPADIYVLSQSMLTKGQITFPKIKNKKSNNGNAITEAELKKKLQEPLGGPNSATIDIGSLIEKNGQSISTVQDLPSLNAFILNLYKSKDFYPVSLKKAGEKAKISYMNDHAVPPVKVTASLDKVEWKDSYAGKATNKIEVHFKVKVGRKSPTDYYINARQFNEGSDIKFQIEQTGGLAFHGKAGLVIGSWIIQKYDNQVKSKLDGLRSKIDRQYDNYKKPSKLFSTPTDIKQSYRHGTIAGTNDSLLEYAGLLSGGAITMMPSTETGHISKVQAAEFGYIIKNPASKGVTSKILYSLYTFAGSRGLVIIDGDSFKNYFASSFHLKVM